MWEKVTNGEGEISFKKLCSVAGATPIFIIRNDSDGTRVTGWITQKIKLS